MYATHLAMDICDFQNIFVFTLKHPIGHPLNKAAVRGGGIYVNGLNNAQVVEQLRNASS